MFKKDSNQIKFDLTIVEKFLNWQDLLDWHDISSKENLSEAFIEKYKDKVDWDEISRNQKLSEAFIEKFQDKVNWAEISGRQKLSEAFIEKNKYKVFWFLISKKQKLSESFIEKMQYYVDWSNISEEQLLSEAFIEKFKHKVNWVYISKYQKLSEKFIARHKNYVNLLIICRYQNLSPEFCEKYLMKYNVKGIMQTYMKIQETKHAIKSLDKKREEMLEYAEKHGLTFDGTFLYAFRDHDKWGRGSYLGSIFYEKGKKYKDWRCDMDPLEENSFGLGIWPRGNTPIKVSVEDWGCSVTKSEGKGRVFAFTVL